MPQRTVSMRKMKEIMRLNAAGLSQRQIATSLNISKGTVWKYLKQAQEMGLDCSLIQDLDGKDLKEAFVVKESRGSGQKYAPLDYQWIHQELKHKGVTLKLLHEEYQRQFPNNPYLYTQFCHYYRVWRSKKDVTIRQVYKAGDQLSLKVNGIDPP